MTEVKQQIEENRESFLYLFSVIENPRIDRHKQYPLVNILAYTFVAILSDQSSWYQIAEFCSENILWFSEFLNVSSGVPSHDTFRRVMSLIKTEQVEKLVIEWIEKTRKKSNVQYRIVALDGKSLRGVSWKVNEKQLHILNAWDSTNNIFLGQLTIGSKTNEITAAPQILKMLNLEGVIITVDAMMTQKEIAKTIIDGGGDYVMALKGNQETLFEDAKLYFEENHLGMSCARTLEKNRGQVEIRTCTKAEDISWLYQKNDWTGLNSLFCIDSEVVKNGKTSKEQRYYITSLNMNANELLSPPRQHWGVENQLHRTLDVQFKEDACQVHDRTAAANLSILRKLALSLLKQINPKKTLISKLKKAAYSSDFRKKCLLGNF